MNEAQDNKVVYLRLDDIIPNRFQPREVFDEAGLQELSDSIKEHGVIQPVVVRPIGNKYELIAGERRTKASALAGQTTIPAIIRDMDDKESAKVSLLENLQRKNLSAIEEARTYKKIIELDNLTQEGLARTMGKSQPMVANKLRLLMLPDEVQDALMKNQISERHARSLLTLKNKKDQLKFLDRIRDERLTVRELDKELKKYKANPEIDEVKQDIIENIEISNEEKKEENNMNNNRGNFGGMGLNDYQSGLPGNMYNNYPNNFNNMPNINNNTNTKYNYNNFNVPDEGNNNSSMNEYFSGMQSSQNTNNSLGSMFDGYNNQNNFTPSSNNTDSSLFVSHIREDNLPKVENQFLPNFDDFSQNSSQNINSDTNEALNNFNQNNSFNDFSNQNEFGNFNNNSNGMVNNYNSQQNNFNNPTTNNYFANDLNSNASNSINNMNDFGMTNSQMHDNNQNNLIPDFNGGMNTMYQPNQGAMFSQPLNIIDVPKTEFNHPTEEPQYGPNVYQNDMSTENTTMNSDINNMTNVHDNSLSNTEPNINNSYDANDNFSMNNAMYNEMNNKEEASTTNQTPMDFASEERYDDMMSQPVNISQEDTMEYNFDFSSEDNNNNTETTEFNPIIPVTDTVETSMTNNLDDIPSPESYISNEKTEDPYEAPKTQKDDYIRLEAVSTINTPMDALTELKKTTDRIKQGNLDIETEEIDFDDVYQITIKIKKTDEII